MFSLLTCSGQEIAAPAQLSFFLSMALVMLPMIIMSKPAIMAGNQPVIVRYCGMASATRRKETAGKIQKPRSQSGTNQSNASPNEPIVIMAETVTASMSTSQSISPKTIETRNAEPNPPWKLIP